MYHRVRGAPLSIEFPETDCVSLTSGVVDLVRGGLHREGEKRAQLTAQELALLRYLVRHAGTTVSRETLLQEVWGYSDQVVSRACDNAVLRIRRKLEPDPTSPHHILTVRGEGYRFQPMAPAAPSATAHPHEPDWLVLGDVRVDLDRHRAVPDGGDPIELTAQEVKILQLLRDADGGVVARTTVVREVWGRASGRAMDHAIRRLRQKIETTPSKPRFLVTVRGTGVALRVPALPHVQDAHGSFVGRTSELAVLQEAIRPGAWILVVGPGGMGKTRLLRRAVATNPTPRKWWIALASARTVSDVVVAAAEALGLVLAGAADPAQRVADALAEAGQGVLALDNLEQLDEGVGPLIERWRAAAPSLCLIGTSRVRLGLAHERCVEVEPLAPEEGATLYETRARAAWGDYRRRGPEVEAVAAVVAHLRGSPLAIELAASRAAVLPASELAVRLDRAHALLSRPGVDRHASLQTTFEMSLDLTTPEERQALHLLALFRRGFSVGDAEGLLGPAGLTHLAVLRDHHLVHAGTEAPFGVYEPLRGYLASKRAGRPDRVDLEARWARWIARLGTPDRLDDIRTGRASAEPTPLRRHAADLEAAAHLAMEAGDPGTATACTCALIAGTVHHAPRDEHVMLAERVRGLSGQSEHDLARIDSWASVALLYLDRAPEAGPIAQRGAETAGPGTRIRAVCRAVEAKVPQRLGAGGEAAPYTLAADAFDAAGEPARAAFCRGRALVATGQVDAGRRSFLLAERTALVDGESITQAHALRELGVIDAAQGRVGRAVERLETALDAFSAVDRVAGAYAVLYFLQDLTLWSGDTEAFRSATERALTACQRRGSRIEEACSRALDAAHHLAHGAHDDSEIAMAGARAALHRHVGEEPTRQALLDWIDAEIALGAGRRDDAVRLASSARVALERVGIPASGAVATTEAAGMSDPADAKHRSEAGVATTTGGAPAGYRAFAWARLGLLAWQHGDVASATHALSEAEQAAASGAVQHPRGWAGRLLVELRQAME